MYVTRAVYAIIVPDLSSSDPVDNQGLILKNSEVRTLWKNMHGIYVLFYSRNLYFIRKLLVSWIHRSNKPVLTHLQKWCGTAILDEASSFGLSAGFCKTTDLVVSRAQVVDLWGSQISAPRCEEEPEIRVPYNLSELADKSLSQDSSGGKWAIWHLVLLTMQEPLNQGWVQDFS